MKEITRTEKVFEFAELTEEAKKKARQKYLEDFRETIYFSENCREYLRQLFPNSALDVEYSLSYCQGDGLNIVGTFDIVDAINVYRAETGKDSRFLRWLDNTGIEIKFTPNNFYQYYTEKCYKINDAILDYMQGFRVVPEKEIQKLAIVVDRVLRKIAKNMEKDGYIYFYRAEDVEIVETWEANNYLGWREDGTPVYN